MQQVMRGHNIVADGWAETANTPPNTISNTDTYTPNTPNTLSNTDTYTKSFKTLIFPLFDSCSRTNGLMDGWTLDRPPNKVRVVCPQLITISVVKDLIFFRKFTKKIYRHILIGKINLIWSCNSCYTCKIYFSSPSFTFNNKVFGVCGLLSLTLSPKNTFNEFINKRAFSQTPILIFVGTEIRVC